MRIVLGWTDLLLTLGERRGEHGLEVGRAAGQHQPMAAPGARAHPQLHIAQLAVVEELPQAAERLLRHVGRCVRHPAGRLVHEAAVAHAAADAGGSLVS